MSDTNGNGTEPGNEPPPLTDEERQARKIAQRDAALAKAQAAVEANVRHRWEELRPRFIEGYINEAGQQEWPSLADISRETGVPYESVKRHSAAEGWLAKRAEYRLHLEQERVQHKVDRFNAETEVLDDEALAVGKLGLALVKNRLADIAQAYQARPRDGSYTGLSTSELERLAKAGDLFHRIGLRSLGGDPDVQKFQLVPSGGGSAGAELAGELGRDDPDRMANVLSVLAVAGLGQLFGLDEAGDRAARRAAAIEVGSRPDPEVPEG